MKFVMIIVGVAAVALCIYWGSYALAILYSLLWLVLFRRVVDNGGSRSASVNETARRNDRR